MTDTITLSGVVATPPRHLIAGSGLPITSFRLACTQRRYDRAQSKWVDADTNWYTISTFRQLAFNTVNSVNKGERIVVTGRLRIRDWQAGEKAGTTVEIEADSLGHDLAWGTAKWTRSTTTSSASDASATASPTDDAFPASIDDGGSGGAAPVGAASVGAAAGGGVDVEADAGAGLPSVADAPLVDEMSVPF